MQICLLYPALISKAFTLCLQLPAHGFVRLADDLAGERVYYQRDPLCDGFHRTLHAKDRGNAKTVRKNGSVRSLVAKLGNDRGNP